MHAGDIQSADDDDAAAAADDDDDDGIRSDLDPRARGILSCRSHSRRLSWHWVQRRQASRQLDRVSTDTRLPTRTIRLSPGSAPVQRHWYSMFRQP